MGRIGDIALATQVAVLGNKRAFDQLVRQYQEPVRRFLLSQTLGNEALCDDLAQDTFLKAYTHIGQYRGTSSLQTWLIRIAYNAWYDYIRKTRKEASGTSTTDDAAIANATDTDYHDSALKEDIGRALAILRAEERSCITLQIVEGYSIDEIAHITGMPPNTVKSHLRRGKDKLANYLRQNGYDR
mgnify:CR=1 FL=1